MFDPESDELVPLSVLAREIPSRTGERGVNTSTLWRWHLRGLRGHRLRTQMIGGIRMSCGRWLAELFAAGDSANGPAARTSTPRQRQRSIEQAERELAEAGL